MTPDSNIQLLIDAFVEQCLSGSSPNTGEALSEYLGLIANDNAFRGCLYIPKDDVPTRPDFDNREGYEVDCIVENILFKRGKETPEGFEERLTDKECREAIEMWFEWMWEDPDTKACALIKIQHSDGRTLDFCHISYGVGIAGTYHSNVRYLRDIPAFIEDLERTCIVQWVW